MMLIEHAEKNGHWRDITKKAGQLEWEGRVLQAEGKA